MDVQMDFTLSRLAMISWSGTFWNRPDINDRILDIFDKRDVDDGIELTNLMIADLMQTAKVELKAMNLPSVIYDRFIEIILSLGLRIMNWYYETSHNDLSIPLRYTKVFYFTVFGTIDEAKTVIENNWLERLNTLRREDIICDIYYKYCASVLKDFINLHAKKMFKFCKMYRRKVTSDTKIDFIVRSLLTLVNPERLNLSEKYKNKLMEEYFSDWDYSKEAYMFSESKEEHQFVAAQYYWRQLTSLEKEEFGISTADGCMVSMYESKNASYPSKLAFDLNASTDVLVFLLSEISEKQKESFFNEVFDDANKISNVIFRKLMGSCAWEDQFFMVFDLIKEQRRNDQNFNYDLIKDILAQLYQKRRIGLDAKTTVYHQMINVVWKEINKFHSPSFSLKDSRLIKSIFRDFFDFEIINLMLEKYAEFRKEFLLIGEIQYKKLIRKNQFDLLDQFVNTVLNSDEERTWFKNKFKEYSVHMETKEYKKKRSTSSLMQEYRYSCCRLSSTIDF